MSLLEHLRVVAAEIENPNTRTRALTALAQVPPMVHQDAFGKTLCWKSDSTRVKLSQNRRDPRYKVKFPPTFALPNLRGKYMTLEDIEAYHRRLYDAVQSERATAEAKAEAARQSPPPGLEPDAPVRIPRMKAGRPSKRETVEAAALGITVAEMRQREAVRYARTADLKTKKRKG